MTLTASGVRISHETFGPAAGTPMVLLHALGDRGISWAPVLAKFAEVFRVTTIDLRGHGDSDWPGSYSFRSMTDDVIDVMDQVGLDHVILIGHSMGGNVALRIAMQRSDLVSRLVVEDAVPPFVRLRPVPARPPGRLDFDWDVVLAIVGEVSAGDVDSWNRLGTISAPTLVVGGGPTSHIPQAKLAEVAELIPQGQLVTIPVGHLVHAEDPDQFSRIVLDWLGRGPAS